MPGEQHFTTDAIAAGHEPTPELLVLVVDHLELDEGFSRGSQLCRAEFGQHGGDVVVRIAETVCDCGAITDIFRGHKFKPNAAEASAVAVKAGTDLTCGTEYRALTDAVKSGFKV